MVARGQTVFAVLNLYPYNPGHLMVCPYRHVADYTELEPAETVELAQFTQAAMRVVRRVSGPQGFNLGMNQGHVGGAGIAAHLHQHVVPRWSGDTNFMPVIGRTKVLPQLLSDTRALLAKAWEERDTDASPAESAAAGRAPRDPAPTKPAVATAAGKAAAGRAGKAGRAAGDQTAATKSTESTRATKATKSSKTAARKRTPRPPVKR